MDHEDFLSTFFTQISQFCFEKAKESIEKERETWRSTQMGPWGMLFMHLPQIVLTERSYADLGFLHTKNKGFLRKDNSLKTMYESLKADLKRVEEMTKGTNAIGAVVTEISSQICQFISARIQLIELYEKMYNMSINNKVMRHQDLLLSIKGIIEHYSLCCIHFSLNTIKVSLMLECEILLQLIKSYIDIQNLKFLPSLMALYEVQARILAWERTLQNRETWKLGFGATFLKTNPQPALYQWILKLRGAILAKFSIYFHVILSQQASSGEMKNIMNKQTIDYYYKLQNFQKKWDILAISFVFDLQDMEHSEPGYRHPKREIYNTENYIMIMSIPQLFNQKSFVHWNNIKIFLNERCTDLKLMDKVILNRDESDMWIYAICNIDPRMIFIVVYEKCNKQKDKDVHVIEFATDICMQMRCNKVFESLKLTK